MRLIGSATAPYFAKLRVSLAVSLYSLVSFDDQMLSVAVKVALFFSLRITGRVARPGEKSFVCSKPFGPRAPFSLTLNRRSHHQQLGSLDANSQSQGLRLSLHLHSLTFTVSRASPFLACRLLIPCDLWIKGKGSNKERNFEMNKKRISRRTVSSNVRESVKNANFKIHSPPKIG